MQTGPERKLAADERQLIEAVLHAVNPHRVNPEARGPGGEARYEFTAADTWAKADEAMVRVAKKWLAPRPVERTREPKNSPQLRAAMTKAMKAGDDGGLHAYWFSERARMRECLQLLAQGKRVPDGYKEDIESTYEALAAIEPTVRWPRNGNAEFHHQLRFKDVSGAMAYVVLRLSQLSPRGKATYTLGCCGDRKCQKLFLQPPKGRPQRFCSSQCRNRTRKPA
jgi:hypothetical protein